MSWQRFNICVFVNMSIDVFIDVGTWQKTPLRFLRAFADVFPNMVTSIWRSRHILHQLTFWGGSPGAGYPQWGKRCPLQPFPRAPVVLLHRRLPPHPLCPLLRPPPSKSLPWRPPQQPLRPALARWDATPPTQHELAKVGLAVSIMGVGVGVTYKTTWWIVSWRLVDCVRVKSMWQTLTQHVKTSSKRSSCITKHGDVPNNVATLLKTSTCLKTLPRNHALKQKDISDIVTSWQSSILEMKWWSQEVIRIALTKVLKNCHTKLHNSRKKFAKTHIPLNWKTPDKHNVNKISQAWKTHKHPHLKEKQNNEQSHEKAKWMGIEEKERVDRG